MAPKKKSYKDILKWLALAAAALNPIGNHVAASHILKLSSSPPPHSEPFLSRYLWLIIVVTLLFGLLQFAQVARNFSVGRGSRLPFPLGVRPLTCCDTEQWLAADGAIACFSSKSLSFSPDADCAPPLKAGVMHR